jgi:SPP1 gp7 family putative phage head morphogenesis protein
VADETVNARLVDEFLQHQHYIEFFKQGQLDDLMTFLYQLMEDLSGVLGRRLGDVRTEGTANTQRLQALLQDVQRLSDDVAGKLGTTVQQQLRDLALYEGGWTVKTVTDVLPVQLDLTTVAPVQLWAAVNERPFEGRKLTTWFSDYTASQRDRLTGSIRMSVVEGETVDQAIRRIRGTQRLNYSDGLIMGLQRRSAEALVRTAVNHVVMTARNATLETNDEVVKAVLWRSTLDNRTSEICIARDGKTYPITSGPRPPAHPNCRSCIVPVIKSWKELGINLQEAPEGTRASMSGQVPASETYASWLNRQSAGFQDTVLGQTRADLFRQ